MIYRQAKALDLPEVSGFRGQYDLMRAIDHVKPAKAALIEAEIQEAEVKWTENRHAALKQPTLSNSEGSSVPKKVQVEEIIKSFLTYY